MDKFVSRLVGRAFLADLVDAEEKAVEPEKTALTRIRTAVETLRADVARRERGKKARGERWEV